MNAYPFTPAALAMVELIDELESIGADSDEPDWAEEWGSRVAAAFLGGPDPGPIGHRELRTLLGLGGLDPSDPDSLSAAHTLISYLLGTRAVTIHCDCGKRRSTLCRALASADPSALLLGAKHVADGTIDVPLARRRWRDAAIVHLTRATATDEPH